MNTMSYIISCCSTTDMTKEHYEEANIKCIGFHYVLGGKSYTDDLWQTMKPQEFYDHIRALEDTSTSQVSVGEYVDYFTDLLQSGQDILHICLSSGISNTVQSATTAADMLSKDFPDQKIYVVDSLCASSGSGLFVDLVVKKREEGLSIEEAYQWALEHRHDVQHWFCSTDLSYFIKGGRVSKVSGVIGGIFQICPLMDVSPSGKLVVINKVRTKKKVLEALVDKMEQHAFDGLKYAGPCYISHSDCIEDAEYVKSLVLKRFKNVKDIPIYYIGTTIGCHTGCGTTALYFLGTGREDA